MAKNKKGSKAPAPISDATSAPGHYSPDSNIHTDAALSSLALLQPHASSPTTLTTNATPSTEDIAAAAAAAGNAVASTDPSLSRSGSARALAAFGATGSSVGFASVSRSRGSSHDSHSSHGHGHGHGHDDHGHSHGGKSHGHSHGGSQLPAPASEADGCSHLAASQTACGHDECLTPSEIKAAGARRSLLIVSAFCFVFMCAELIGGYISNSLAIMTDAAHLLSDLASFLISIVSLFVSRKAATSSLSFGFHRAEILGAIVSVLLIWVLTGALLFEAFERFKNPVPINGKVMFIVATLGLIVNFAMGMILMYTGHGHSHGGLPGGAGHSHSHGGDDHGHSHGGADSSDDEDHGHSHGAGSDHGHSHGGERANLLGPSIQSHYGSAEHHDDDDDDHAHSGHAVSISDLSLFDRIFNNPNHNINVRAAMIHVLGDAVQSAGVIIAAALIWWQPSWSIADPLCTVMFSIIVLFTTIRILREAVIVLMEGVPEGTDVDAVRDALRSVPGVAKVHDLHVWSLSVGNTALSVHLEVLPDASAMGAMSPVTPAPGGNPVLARAQHVLKKRFGITHTTIQIETVEDELLCNSQVTQRPCVRVSGAAAGHASL